MPLFELQEQDVSVEMRDFFCRVITVLHRTGIPFMAGGAYAIGCYTGIRRDTKDFDIFLRPGDFPRTLAVLQEAGYRAELIDPVWLGKIYVGDVFLDIIFGSANGLCTVDDAWFANAPVCRLLDFELMLVPAEEMIWSKSFVMTRDRYDGSDINHLLLKQAESLDWNRLLARFDEHWRVLYSYLVIFGYVYPGERGRIPVWVMDQLSARLNDETRAPAPPDRICRGTLLSTTQYVIDLADWKFLDARQNHGK